MEKKKIECPCCGFYTIDDDTVIVDICPVCFWQYDVTAQSYPQKIIGPNKVTLNTAISNYKKIGVSDINFKGKVRLPLNEELPENNM